MDRKNGGKWFGDDGLVWKVGLYSAVIGFVILNLYLNFTSC